MSCEGENVENDDSNLDENINAGVSAKESKLDNRITHGVVISGEASESDEEIDSQPVCEIPLSGSEYSLNESWNKQAEEKTEESEVTKEECMKHNTLLHKKLRERNQSARKRIIEVACQPYQSASKEIHGISQQLIKSQMLVQEVTSTLRRLTNELFSLEDKVQSIRSGACLADVEILLSPQDR